MYDVVASGGGTGYPPDWIFQDSMVLLGFWASVTSRIGLSTGIVALPQRQTLLFAKQTATLDRLAGGRLRLGLGLGATEGGFRVLGADFATRADRMGEQIEVLRRLWTEPAVAVEGRDHRLDGESINPRPLQQPIPVWLSGHSDASLELCARFGDGWLPGYRTPDEARSALARGFASSAPSISPGAASTCRCGSASGTAIPRSGAT